MTLFVPGSFGLVIQLTNTLDTIYGTFKCLALESPLRYMKALKHPHLLQKCYLNCVQQVMGFMTDVQGHPAVQDTLFQSFT